VVTTDKGIESRQRIIEVAARAFAERGYDGASLNEIIRQTGLTKGGFYFHFDSKASLAIAVIEHLRETTRARVLEAVEPGPANAQIEAMVRAIVRSKHQDPSMAAIGRVCRDLGEAEPQLRGELGHFEGWFETTEALFRTAQAEGSMESAIDPAAAAWFAVTAFVGADFVADLRGEDLDARIDTYLEHVARAVGLTRP
jgi:AcrR family transcriptional regulator